MGEEESRSDDSNEQGIVMLVVLWMLTAAVILVASFNGAARSGAASSISEIGLTKSEAVLDAGLELAVAHLIDQDEGRRWQGNGKKLSIPFAQTELSIAAWDANGRVDLNKSDPRLLKAIFQAATHSPSQSEQYTSAIMNAREAASNPNASAPGGSEAKATDTFAAPFPFDDVWQLADLSKIPVDVVGRVAPYLTVFSRDGAVDPRAAPETVLTAVPGVTNADLVQLRSASTSALSDLIQKSDGLLTDQSGPAFIIQVQCHPLDEDYSVSRTYAVLIGIDQARPYRLLAKWPMESIAAGGTH